MKSINSTCTCCCFCCRRWCERKLFGGISSQVKFIAILSSTFWLFIVHFMLKSFIMIFYNNNNNKKKKKKKKKKKNKKQKKKY